MGRVSAALLRQLAVEDRLGPDSSLVSPLALLALSIHLFVLHGLEAAMDLQLSGFGSVMLAVFMFLLALMFDFVMSHWVLLLELI